MKNQPFLSLTFGALACSALMTSVPAAAQIDPNQFLNQFESTFGKHEGFRRSGAKGICARGEFVGSSEGRALSVASAFSGQPVPVVVRFSVGGANPKAADNTRSQRNLALQFNLPESVAPPRPNSFWAACSRCSPTPPPRLSTRPRSRPLPTRTPRCCCRASTWPASRCRPALPP